jgi:DNA-binding MarR family transcriptional regulator
MGRTKPQPSQPGADDVDGIIAAWARERPDLDVSSVGVISRVTRLAAGFTHAMDATFAVHGLTRADFEALAALRRSGSPHRLAQGELMRVLSLSPGSVSVRVDRLVANGWAKRETDAADRRGAVVALTPSGRRRFDAAVPDHLATQRRLLEALDGDERERLAALLRRLLLSQSGESS